MRVSILLLLFHVPSWAALKLCSEFSDEPELCQMKHGYKSNYPSHPHPQVVDVKVMLYDITEISDQDQTLTLITNIALTWEDLEISFNGEPNATR